MARRIGWRPVAVAGLLLLTGAGAVGAGGAAWVGQEAVAVTYALAGLLAGAGVWLLVLPATPRWDGSRSAGAEHEGQQPPCGHDPQRRHE